MKKFLLVLSIFLISFTSTEAQTPQLTVQYRTAFAWEAVTVTGAAGGVGFTAATFNPTVTDMPSQYSRAELAVVNCNGADIRYRVDGGTVTSSNGMLVRDGDWILIYGYTNINAFRAIRTASTSVTCDATYYRNR